MMVASLVVSGLAGCGSSQSGDGKGKVYYLNFKPEINDEWQALAKAYTEATGVEVTVVTAASDTYESTLRSEITKDDAPTLFQVNGPVGLKTWEEYCDDMSDTEPYNQLKDQSQALKNSDGTIVAVPYVEESYGIIYNKDLLTKYTQLSGAKISSVDDIKSFDKLKQVADDIQARKAELGVEGAFSSAGFDSSSDWRFAGHLANMPLFYEFRDDNITDQPATIKGSYLDNFKRIFDLYTIDSTTDRTLLSSKTVDDSTTEFATGKSVFYQNGTWAWDALKKAGVASDSVGMIPIYIGVPGEENQGLAMGSENYWCVNKDASDADKQATKDFLKWLVTSDDAKTALTDHMGFITPFKTMQNMVPDNPLSKAAADDANNPDTYNVDWVFERIPSTDWKSNLGSALLNYAQGTGDWNAVRTAFVDGWATEYANSSGN